MRMRHPLRLTGVGGARHASMVFRAVGYLPVLTDVLGRRRPWDDATRGAIVDPLLRDEATSSADVSCGAASWALCTAIGETVAWAVARHMAVVVVTPPYITRRHEAQQESIASMVAERFRGQTRVRVVNMGRAIDLRDRAQSFDGIHPTPLGNQTIGQNLIEPTFQLLQSR